MILFCARRHPHHHRHPRRHQQRRSTACCGIIPSIVIMPHWSTNFVQERSVLPGVIITAIYINRYLLENFAYHHLNEPQLRPDLQDSHQVRVCGQNSSQFKGKIYQQTCGRILYAADYNSIHASKTGIWYCRACSDFICKNSTKIVYNLENFK